MNLEQSKDELKQYICDACKLFYSLGWASGTGGGMSIKTGDTALVAPSGVEKEKLSPEDIFEIAIKDPMDCLDNGKFDAGKLETVEASANSDHKISACTPLFFAAFTRREAGAVIHSHSVNAFLASKIAIEKRIDSREEILISKSIKERKDSAIAEIVLEKMEFLKGITGLGYESRHCVPVIKNTPHETDLTESLVKAIENYPESYAVVVENHGVYIWGKDHTEAKRHAESYDYMLHAYVRMYELGLDRGDVVSR